MKRANGEGSFDVRGKTIYWVLYVNKKRKKIRLRAQSIPEAEKEIRKYSLVQDLQTKEEIALFVGRAKGLIATEDRLTFAAAWKSYIKSPLRSDCGETLQKQKAYVWKRLSEFAKEHDVEFIQDVTNELLAEWQFLLKKSKKPKTVNTYFVIIKEIFRHFKLKNMFEGIKKLHVNPQPMQFLTKEQIYLIFEAIDGKMDLQLPFRDEMKVLFRIGAYTGLRLKDACLLQWDSILLKRNLINCQPHKTANSSGEYAWIPIHPNLLKTLQQLPKKSKFVLPGVAERYSRNPKGIQHDVAKTMNWAFWPDPVPGRRPPKAGKYGFHSFRHSLASFCANEGVPIMFLEKILGDSSAIIKRYYTHLNSQAMEQVITALP